MVSKNRFLWAAASLFESRTCVALSHGEKNASLTLRDSLKPCTSHVSSCVRFARTFELFVLSRDGCRPINPTTTWQANDHGMAQVGIWHQEMADAYCTSLKDRGLITDTAPVDSN